MDNVGKVCDNQYEYNNSINGMKLSQLIAKIGDKNVRVQYVTTDMTNIKYSEKKKISTITFLTDQLTPNDVLLNEGKVGIIVWIPRDKWMKINENL